ncbi:phospholipid scramblase 1-like isoform X3 [Dermacentor albipictus]|uniref:phospholipid scramblase 1-like isoform X3 n=1 Tax=Dermacentor albipictus TaxID=60249 RepID=UPI0031FD14F6
MAPGQSSRPTSPGAGPAHPAAGSLRLTSLQRSCRRGSPARGLSWKDRAVTHTMAPGQSSRPTSPGAGPAHPAAVFLPNVLPSEYLVTNAMDQFVFKVTEDDNLLCTGLGPRRAFQMGLHDSRDAEVLRLDRPLRCDSCLCFCCLQKMDVRDQSGATIGSLRMQCTLLFPNFTVLDSHNNAVLLIRGPCCTRAICCDTVKFDIVTMDGVTKIGAITKLWSGSCKEACSIGDSFAVTFPLDLDVKMKAVLLGAVFLLDAIYYEGGDCATCRSCVGQLICKTY